MTVLKTTSADSAQKSLINRLIHFQYQSFFFLPLFISLTTRDYVWLRHSVSILIINMPHRPDNDADAAQLAALGHKGELNRNFSPLSMLGLAFAILNSWTALAASLSLALPSGGPVSVLWGLTSKLARSNTYYNSLTFCVAAGVCNLCLAVSLAEFLSAYPTAGGTCTSHFARLARFFRSTGIVWKIYFSKVFFCLLH
jgi:hypothetical protein